MNEVIITVDSAKRTVEFKRQNGTDILETKLFPNGFEIVWRPFVTQDIFVVKSEDDQFTIGYREIDTVTYPTELSFYDYLKSISDYTSGSGGGGGGSATDTLQLEQIDQQKPKERKYFFGLADLLLTANEPSFPLTCIISVNHLGSFETVASATYADMDALVSAFNSGISFYNIEKRTETSFYVLSDSINKYGNTTDFIGFSEGITGRVYYYYNINKGAYPYADITANDLILDERLNSKGLGVKEVIRVVNPINYTLAGFKNVSVVCDGLGNDISIGTAFSTPVTFPNTLQNGYVDNVYELSGDTQCREILTINNVGALNNAVTITVEY